MNSIAIIAHKKFHRSHKELSKLFQTKHPDHSQLSILIDCFDKIGLVYEFYSWEEFEETSKDKYDLFVIPQQSYLSGSVPTSEAFWKKLRNLRRSGTTFLFLHHPADVFIEKKFLDIDRGYSFPLLVSKYNIVTNKNDELLSNIDKIIATRLKAKDEFTYFEKSRSKFITLIEKLPVYTEIRRPEKCICFGYQNNTSGSRTYFMDIHAVGSSELLNGVLFKQIINNLYSNIFHKSLTEDEILDNIITSSISETKKKALIDSRIGQGKFRNQLIKYWHGCSITKVDFIEILKASHIKPWNKSNNHERLDLFNGLLLLPNLDLLFDKGYITFDINGKIIISKLLPKKDLIKLGVLPKMKISLHKNHEPYLKYHRENVFKKSL